MNETLSPKAKSNSSLFAMARRFILVIMILAVLAKAATPSWNNVMALLLGDNDDAMRILQVRAWLDGQGFYDIVNHRLNPPNGGDIHWSRLADVPLAACNLILRPFLGATLAEKVAAFFTPPILAFAFIIISGKTAKALFDSKIAFYLGAVFAALTAASMNYFKPGRVDHHGLQLIFMMCGFLGLFSQNKKGAILSGLAIAASLTIGFELAPILVIMVGFVALRWLARGQNVKTETLYFSIALLIGSCCGFIINVPPFEWLISHNDALSLAQLAPIATGSIGLMVAAQFLSHKNLFWRLGAVLVIAVLVIAVALQFPVLMKPLYWQTGALLQRLWIDVISETEPLIKGEMIIKLHLGLASVILSALSLLYIAKLLISGEYNKNSGNFDNWMLAGLSLVSVMLLTIFWQLRVAGQAAIISSVAGAALVAIAYRQYSLMAAIFVAFFVNPVFPTMAAIIEAKIHPAKNEITTPGGGNKCKGPAAFATIAARPKGLIAAPIDFGAHALISTHHNVLAAPYHRNQGNLTAYNIFLASPAAAKELIIASNVNYVGFCLKSAENRNISREAPNGLMAMLKSGKYPDYLRPIPNAKNSDIVTYEVIK